MMREFGFVKKGYDPIEVDKYVINLEEVIQSYKEKDSSIKNAILSAQVAADTIVQNSKNEASALVSSAMEQLQDIRNSISIQKEMLAQFQDEYQQMIKKYLLTFDIKDSNSVLQKINNLDNYISKLEKKSPTTDSN